MKQCLGPCVHAIDADVYTQMAIQIRKFLNGDVKEILAKLEQEMNEASENLQFERAKEKHDLMQAIAYVTAKQQIDFKDGKDRDVFGCFVDKGYISIQGLFLRGGKMLERTLHITPLYEN